MAEQLKVLCALHGQLVGTRHLVISSDVVCLRCSAQVHLLSLFHVRYHDYPSLRSSQVRRWILCHIQSVPQASGADANEGESGIAQGKLD